MKHCVTWITLLALTAPVFAQTINITLVDNGNGSFTIGYNTADDGFGPIDVAGVSLVMTLSGGNGVLEACGDAVAASPFNANIEYFYKLHPSTPVLGAGCPVGAVGGPGLPIFPATSFAISTGVLGTPAPAGAPAAGGDICTIQLVGTTETTVTLSADIDRGGIVGVGGVQLTPSFPLPTVFICSSFCFPGATCGGNSGNQQADDFVAFGAPSCWCEQYHCDGDADIRTQGFLGVRVGSIDLAILIRNWLVKASTPGWEPCADIDHKPQGFLGIRVGSVDLNIMITNWQAKASDLPGDCPRP